jgi:hypothetical protein
MFQTLFSVSAFIHWFWPPGAGVGVRVFAAKPLSLSWGRIRGDPHLPQGDLEQFWVWGFGSALNYPNPKNMRKD